jgi:hypothetical protein
MYSWGLLNCKYVLKIFALAYKELTPILINIKLAYDGHIMGKPWVSMV